MKIQKSSRQSRRLRGSDFNPPRRPDFLTRSPIVAFNDWRHATHKGQADALGHNMSDEKGVPHAERLMDAQADRGKEDLRYGFRKPKENAMKVKEDAKKEQEHAGREIAEIDPKDAKLAQQEKPYEDRRGPGTPAHVAIFGALFGLTFPIDLGAASWLPIPPLGQWMVAIFIGVLMVLCAQQTAKKIEDLEESYAERERNMFRYRKDQAALVTLLGFAITVIIGTTIWRGAVFSTDATMTGAPIHSTAANVALGLLATLAFAVAVVAGMAYRRMEPLRVIRKARKKLDEQRKHWRAKKDLAERRERAADVTLTYLAEREEHVLKAIDHWAQERKARFRQRAAKIAMKELKKASGAGGATAPS